MSFELSFSPEFFGDVYNTKESKQPTTLADALSSIPDCQWKVLAEDLFDTTGEYLSIDDLYLMAIETNTCSSLSSPVSVWIDPNGEYTVEVYDKPITDEWEVVRHGREFADYFQGCGVCFTPFDHVVTGVGSTEKDAGDDALEQLAQCDFDIASELETELAELPDDTTDCDCDMVCECPEHRVSIRWR